VGITIAGVIFLVVFAGLVGWCAKRRYQPKHSVVIPLEYQYQNHMGPSVGAADAPDFAYGKY
jgi:hypothetical protein